MNNMLLLEITSIDSFREAVIDSVIAAQKSQFNPADLINKIDGFYNNAWTKLAILFGLVGVCIPLIINYIQVKRNEKDQENIKSSITLELQKEIDNKLKENLDRIESQMEEKLVKIQHASEGVTYHIQSDLYFDKSKFKESFAETVNALTCYYIGDDYNNFINAMEDLETRCAKISKPDIADIQSNESDYYNIDKLLERIEKDNNDKYVCLLTKLHKAIKAIKD